MRTRTALIVGAGIGGLASGLALRRAGWRIQVFERAATPRELGFALGLAPNALAALRELGLDGVMQSEGASTTAGEIQQPGGRVLNRFEVAFGGPAVVALRPALHGALLAAVGDEALVLGREAVDRRRADWRRWHRLGDQEAPAAQRSTAPAERPLRNSGRRVRRRTPPGGPLGRVLPRRWRRGRDGSREPGRGLLLFDRDPIDDWGRGPVTLLEDAAHPMLPHAGQGAAQALEDAVALGLVLTPEGDIPAALRRYERVRSARSRSFVLLSRRISRVTTTHSPVVRWVRDTAIRLIPDRLVVAGATFAARSRDPHRLLRS